MFAKVCALSLILLGCQPEVNVEKENFSPVSVKEKVKPVAAKNPCSWFSKPHFRWSESSEGASHQHVAIECLSETLCLACTHKQASVLDCRKFNPQKCF